MAADKTTAGEQPPRPLQFLERLKQLLPEQAEDQASPQRESVHFRGVTPR